MRTIFSVPSNGNAQFLGLFGDFFGGVWGTIFSALTFLVVFFTWRNSRKSDHRNSIINILTEMLKTHDLIVSDNPKLSKRYLSEFSLAYTTILDIISTKEIIDVDTRIDIAYTYTFYGLSSSSLNYASRINSDFAKKLHDQLNLINSRRVQYEQERVFRGYQDSISHYMRNLFGMHELIDRSKLNLFEKHALAKIIRTKLSNYDQAMLALNIISHLGSEWEKEGFVDKYKPFSNVPKDFFGVDDNINLSHRFPMVQFEWMREGGKLPQYRRLAIGALKLVWYREWYRPTD